MVRLIDADDLIKDIDYSADLGGALGKVVECVKYYAKFMVASAPTKEERKTGKWIDETFEPWGLVYHPYKCNQCGEHSEAASNYCPNCGSEMRGYDEGTADDI